MRVLGVISLLLLLASCGQDSNSNSGDNPGTPPPGEGGTVGGNSDNAAQRLSKAIGILTPNCFSCHKSWSAFTTDKQWIDAGLVVAGNTKNSTVINRLINAGSDMPKGKGAISDADYQALQDWVKGVSP